MNKNRVRMFRSGFLFIKKVVLHDIMLNIAYFSMRRLFPDGKALDYQL